jgi:hypothetical protein
MARLDLTVARREALFASGLPRSEAGSAQAVVAAIGRAVREFGITGCAARMAQEFGDHPEAAAERMGWVRQAVDGVFGVPAARRVTTVMSRRPLARAA